SPHTSHGFAVFGYGGAYTRIDNSILWNDYGHEVGVAPNTSCTVIVNNSDVDQAGYSGSNGNIQGDPLFVRPGVPSAGDFGDVRLRTGSPVINAGNNTLIPPGLTT